MIGGGAALGTRAQRLMDPLAEPPHTAPIATHPPPTLTPQPPPPLPSSLPEPHARLDEGGPPPRLFFGPPTPG